MGRLIKSLKGCKITQVSPTSCDSIDKFVLHYVWHGQDIVDGTKDELPWMRLENRLNEMVVRRKRLLKNLTKKENPNILVTEVD